jgi:lysophospholipase L1-like esterase
MSSSENPTRRPFLFIILTPVLAIGAVFVLFEAGLRIAGYNPLKSYLSTTGHEFYIRESSNPKLRYELNPGFQGKVGPFSIRINAAGLRGPEIDLERTDRLRVALLGDSLTFSRDINEDLIFPTLLGAALRKVNPAIEVLNMGVEGFDTLEEMEFLKGFGLRLHPDYVVLIYCLNDIGVTMMDIGTRQAFMQPRIPIRYSSRFWLWLELKLKRISLQKTLGRRLDSGRTFEDIYTGLFSPVEQDDFLTARFAEIDASQAAFDRTKGSRKSAVAEKSGRLWLQEYKSLLNLGKIRYAFQELKKTAETNGFKVLVGIVPFFYKIDGNYLDGPAHAIVRREAERQGLETFDLYEALNAQGLESLALDSVHLNVRGHQAMTGVLEAILAPRLKNPGQGE